MNDIQSRTLTRIIADFNTTYSCFLLDHGLRDGPVPKASFCLAIEDIVRRDPMPDEELQDELEKYLTLARTKAVEGYVEAIEATVYNVSMMSMRVR